jgi:hypothetical protein
MPKAENASTYPSKDSHPEEKITAAIDVYNTSPKDDIFNTHYLQEGILPVFLVITNDGDKPISMTKMQAQLVTSSRSKLDALTADDVMRRIGHINASSTGPSRTSPFPIPGGNKNKKAQQQLEEVNRPLQRLCRRAAFDSIRFSVLRCRGRSQSCAGRPHLPYWRAGCQRYRVDVLRYSSDYSRRKVAIYFAPPPT